MTPAHWERFAGCIPYENLRMTLSVRSQYSALPLQGSQNLSSHVETPTTQTAVNPSSTEPSPTSAGDKKLVGAYIAAVQKKILHQDAGLIKVPADSQLGQWLELYRSHLQNPVVVKWMRDQGVQIDVASIIPSTGVLTFGEGESKKTFTLTDNSGWGQIAGPILDAAKIISPVQGQRLRVDINGDEVVVYPKLVADFYGETLPTSKSKASTQIRQLEKNGNAFQPIPASHRSSEALQTQKLNAARFYQSAPQALAYKQLAVDVANNLPNTRAEAKKWAEALILELTGKQVDADTIYLNRFKGGGHTPYSTETSTITGWEYTNQEPYSSLRLPDALLKNFSENDWDPGVLDSMSGLYTDGPGQSQKKGYGAHNQFPLLPSAVMHESWKTDFQGEMTKKFDSFWGTHTDEYRTAIKGEFTYRARKQLKAVQAMPPAERALQAPEHRFTREDYRLVMGAVPNLPLDENTPLNVEQLKAQARLEGEVHALNIAGIASTDILRFSAADDGRQVLYIPGAEPAFLRFDSLEKLERWVVDQTKDDKKCAALASHFPLILRQNHEAGTLGKIGKVLMPILWFTDLGTHKDGLDTTLKKLASGELHPAIHANHPPIEGDVFSAMSTATQHRMTSDADVVIKSNSEVTRDTWLNDITVAAGLLAKLAPIAAPVAGAAAIAGLTELVLGTEKQASGDTEAERQDGASKAFDGLLNTLFSIGASAVPEDPFAIPPEKEIPVVEPRPQPEVTVNEEPQPGPSTGPAPTKPPVPAPLPRAPSLLPIAQYTVRDAEELIKSATRDAMGVYRMTDSTGAYRQFVRITDETNTSRVFEIHFQHRSGSEFAGVINPKTGRVISVVTPGNNGEWARVAGDGGLKWPWQRGSSPAPSDSLNSQFSDLFADVDEQAVTQAKKFDEYLNVDETTPYSVSTRGFEDNGVLKRKLNLSWQGTADERVEIYASEKAGPTELSTSNYSPNFLLDLNRNDYTVIKASRDGDLVLPLSAKGGSAEAIRQNRLKQFEDAIPDADLRARISEVAHQGSVYPANAELLKTLKEGYGAKVSDTSYFVDYDPLENETKVRIVAKWYINDLTGDNPRVIPDIEATTTRTFTIRKSNEVSGDPYLIDDVAPTHLEVSVPADLPA
ncbi:dermonecrotic toxin domain-containing protein [Pseudomonas sp. LF245]